MGADPINWLHISENEFNRLAEALIVKDRTDEGLVAQAVDGRGGDGGTDIDVHAKQTNQLVEILQLKWFPEGFSNKFVSRRQQIKKSFNTAMELNPHVWTLVLPARLTPKERMHVWGLKKKNTVRIQFIGATELDLLLAKYPDIHSWAMRDSYREALLLVARETAALNKPGDLAAEVQRLSARDDAKSIYWGTNFAFQNGTMTQELYAKRPDAQEHEPLSFTLQTRFGDADADLREEFQFSLDYGVLKPLVLPPHIAVSVARIGPDWFASQGGPGEVHLMPQELEEKPKLTVQSCRSDGSNLYRISGRATAIANGPKGFRVECSFPGGLTHEWRIPISSAEPGKIDLSFHPTGFAARDIQRALRFIASTHAAERLVLDVGGKKATVALPPQGQVPLEPALIELIDDLSYIETSLDVDFEFPAELPDALDRVWIRAIRRILEGRMVVLPNTSSLSVVLAEGHDEAIATMLADEGAALYVSEKDWSVEIMGLELTVGVIGIHQRRIRAEDAATHRQALDAGKAGGRTVRLVPADGDPFTIFSPSRRTDDSPKVVEPWGLTGIPEHKNLGMLDPLKLGQAPGLTGTN